MSFMLFYKIIPNTMVLKTEAATVTTLPMNSNVNIVKQEENAKLD